MKQVKDPCFVLPVFLILHILLLQISYQVSQDGPKNDPKGTTHDKRLIMIQQVQICPKNLGITRLVRVGLTCCLSQRKREAKLKGGVQKNHPQKPRIPLDWPTTSRMAQKIQNGPKDPEWPNRCRMAQIARGTHVACVFLLIKCNSGVFICVTFS